MPDKYQAHKNTPNTNNLFYLPSVEIRMSNMKQQQNHNVLTLNHGGSMDPDKNLNNNLAPVNKPRFIQDAILWRDAIRIAEQAVLPFRYLMQLQYMDTVLDNHIRACLKRREGLQLNRKYKICNENGVEDEKWTRYFKKTWFKTWLKYALEAKWYGYTLISMGDLEKYKGEWTFKCGEGGIVMIPRTHISPDRLCVSVVPEATTGAYFTQEPWKNTHIWINTPDEHGLAACGYGALYEVTLLAISLRNNLFYNEQFLEIFGMPFRWVTTDRLDATNQERLEAMMEMMGSLGYGILGPNEKMEFIDTGKGGAYKGYGDLENRLEKKISQTLLGHSDAMASTPGKIGGNQGGEVSPQAMALNDIQAEDGDFLCEQINGKLIPFCRNNGINIPEDLHFEFSNDFEEKEMEKWTNEQNISKTATLVNLVNAGFPPTVEQVQDQTGWIIDTTKIAKNEQAAAKQVKVDFPSKSQLTNLNTTSDKEYDKLKTSREKYAAKLDKVPALKTDEGEEYKEDMVSKRIDEEYQYLSEGIDGNEDGMTKEEYQQYQDDLPDRVTENDLQDGDVGVHQNCQCVILGGVWTFGDDPCDDCQNLGDEWNDEATTLENKMRILNLHKAKNNI